MLFSSVLFLFYFLPITLVLYFVVPKKFKNLVLFVVSLVFYAWGEPVYIVIMLFSTVFNYFGGILIGKYDNNERIRKAILIISVVGSLTLLCFFKYTDFILGNINNIFNTDLTLLTLPLPIGISFYTFQIMSYTIDVYRRDVPIQKNIISFGAYVTLFPQLVAGPIVRYGTIAGQLNDREETYDKFASGLSLFCCGLGKKVIFANSIGMLFDIIKNTPIGEISVLGMWLGIIAFAFQIYFDFSGYSDMAIGLGRMFGFEFLENFNYPYISRSISEFWRRWHISMGTWFREYVYIPLGGNRVKIPRMLLNLVIVWFLTGLWHGASWNFVVWGLYYGAILILEKLFLLKLLEKLPKVLQHIYSLLLILLGWTFFAADNLLVAGDYIKIMFGFGVGGFVGSSALYYLVSYFPLLIVLVIASLPYPKKLFDAVKKKTNIIVPVFSAIVLIISIAYLVDSTYNPFLYFRF